MTRRLAASLIRGCIATLALSACAGANVVELGNSAVGPQPGVIDVAPSTTAPRPTTIVAPTTTATTATTATSNLVKLATFSAISPDWAVFVGVANLDALSILQTDIPSLPPVASNLRYVVVSLGVRYTGTGSIGLSQAIKRQLIDSAGRPAGSLCDTNSDLFDDVSVVPDATAELPICAILLVDQLAGVRLRINDGTKGTPTDFALHANEGQTGKQPPPRATPKLGLPGTIGSPAGSGVAVKVGPALTVLVESITRLEAPNLPAGTVGVRVVLTITASGADASVERTAFGYGAYTADLFIRFVGTCPGSRNPPPLKLGQPVTFDRCMAMASGQVSTLYVHELTTNAVGYFAVPAVG